MLHGWLGPHHVNIQRCFGMSVLLMSTQGKVNFCSVLGWSPRPGIIICLLCSALLLVRQFECDLAAWSSVFAQQAIALFFAGKHPGLLCSQLHVLHKSMCRYTYIRLTKKTQMSRGVMMLACQRCPPDKHVQVGHTSSFSVTQHTNPCVFSMFSLPSHYLQTFR